MKCNTFFPPNDFSKNLIQRIRNKMNMLAENFNDFENIYLWCVYLRFIIEVEVDPSFRRASKISTEFDKYQFDWEFGGEAILEKIHTVDDFKNILLLLKQSPARRMLIDHLIYECDTQFFKRIFKNPMDVMVIGNLLTLDDFLYFHHYLNRHWQQCDLIDFYCKYQENIHLIEKYILDRRSKPQYYHFFPVGFSKTTKINAATSFLEQLKDGKLPPVKGPLKQGKLGSLVKTINNNLIKVTNMTNK